jgi:hypothetical protein
MGLSPRGMREPDGFDKIKDQSGAAMGTLKYGARFGNAMDDCFDIARQEPGRSERQLAAWSKAQEATALYRVWIDCVGAPSEAFAVSEALPRIALSALDGLDKLGLSRRLNVLAEAMDAQVSSGDGGLVGWLASHGAPLMPGLGQGGKTLTRSDLEKVAYNGVYGHGLPLLSWCAMAASNLNLSSIAALEKCGWGARERLDIFNGLAQKLGSEKAALDEFVKGHPWVVAMSLSPDQAARKGFKALAADIQALWKPSDPYDLDMAWRAIHQRSMDNWSVMGMEALAQRGKDMDKSEREKTAKSMIGAIEYAAGGSKDAKRYALSAMRWAASSSGPSSGEMLLELANKVEMALMGKGGSRSGSESADAIASLAMGAALMSKSGKWGKADKLVAKEAGLMVCTAAASMSPANAELGAGIKIALDAIDALAGSEHAPAKSGPKRM